MMRNLTVQQVAEHFNTFDREIHKWTDSKRLHCEWVNGKRMIPESCLEEFADRMGLAQRSAGRTIARQSS